MRTTPQLATIQRLLRSRDGNIAIVTALIMPVIVGFCALGAETSYWYYRHQTVQGAADIAAYGSAVVLGRGGEEADIVAAARADAITNGWRQASGTITVKQDGPFVEVLLIENQQRYFSRFLCGDSPVQISARGVAAGFRGGAKLVWAEEPKRPSKSSCASIAERSQRPQAPRPQAPERAPRARADSDPARAK